MGECVAPGANEKDRARSDFGYGASWLIGKRRISPKRGEPGVTPILVVCRINTRLRRQGPIGGDLQRRLQRAITWTTLCKRVSARDRFNQKPPRYQHSTGRIIDRRLPVFVLHFRLVRR